MPDFAKANLRMAGNENGTNARARTPLAAQVILLSLASLLNDSASEMIFPLLPLFLSGFAGSTPLLIGMIEASAEALSAFLKLLAGWWSDRVPKRKPFVVAGYAFAAVSRVAIALAGSWHVVFGARLFDRTGKGIRSAPRDAMIADASPPAARGHAFGFQRAMDHTGAVIGPLIAAALLEGLRLPLRHVFMIAVIPGALGALMLLVFLREPPKTTGPRHQTEPAGRLPSSFWWPVVSIALFYLANSSDVYLILRASAKGVGIAWIPILWSAHHLVKSLFSTAAGSLSDRVDRRVLLALGWGIYGVIYVLFPLAKSLPIFLALFIAYAIPFTLTEGAERAWIASFVPAALRGNAFGVYYLIIGVFTLGGTALFGWIYQRSPALAFQIGAAIAVLAAISVLLQKREKPARA